jgi:lipid-binding SYLF domain-containing protein
MRRTIFLSVVIVSSLSVGVARAASDPESTVHASDEVLAEIVTIPGHQIPAQMLAEAQGVAVIPDVIKIGFIGGVRRGHGVVLVRDAEGEWGLPQFVTITGGSIGWQAGVQATDVVLVFRTKKSIDGLMQGKFTLGGDVSVAAGPVGRDAAAATDVQLKAEILSYSRCRGIFAGAAFDGSLIQIDEEAHGFYYGTPSNMAPARVPRSAIDLVQEIATLSATNIVPPPSGSAAPGPVAMQARPEVIRRALARDATNLFAVLDPTWRAYLGLPPEVFQANGAPTPPPSLDSLQRSLQAYDRVAQDARYRSLSERPEFQTTREVLRSYVAALSVPAQPGLALPPPPVPTLN